MVAAPQSEQGILVLGIDSSALLEPFDGFVILAPIIVNDTDAIVRSIVFRVDFDCFLVPFEGLLFVLLLLVELTKTIVGPSVVLIFLDELM